MTITSIAIPLALLAAFAAITAIFAYGFPKSAVRFFVELERYRAKLSRKEIRLPDGLRYVYLEGGKGEPLLLLHGFGADKDAFVRVAGCLTPYYRVIIPDHIGFGESDHPPAADYSPPAQVERLRALMQALGINHFHLGGNSMGGQISMTYAALHPSEVSSLWLLGPAGVWNSGPHSEVFKIIEETGYNSLLARNEAEFARIFAFTMSDPPFIPRPMLNVIARDRISNFPLEERIFREISSYSVETHISGLNIPTLIVFGDQDRAIPVATADVLHKLLPNSQVVIMPGIGHLPMLERPRASASDYLQFRMGLNWRLQELPY